VGKASGDEGVGEIDGSPPSGLSPDIEHDLHNDARRVALLRHGWRPMKHQSIVLHLGFLG
jgi:hypothetical protein